MFPSWFLIMGISCLPYCQAQNSEIYRRCPEPPESSYVIDTISTKDKFFAIAISKVDSMEDNLLKWISSNPCLEIGHIGPFLQHASQYSIYGSCDMQRMFRFILRRSGSSECWEMELRVFDPDDNSSTVPCQIVPLARIYTMVWSYNAISILKVGFSNEMPFQVVNRSTILFLHSTNQREKQLYADFDRLYSNQLNVINRTDCIFNEKDHHLRTIWNYICTEKPRRKDGLNKRYWIVGIFIAGAAAAGIALRFLLKLVK